MVLLEHLCTELALHWNMPTLQHHVTWLLRLMKGCRAVNDQQSPTVQPLYHHAAALLAAVVRGAPAESCATLLLTAPRESPADFHVLADAWPLNETMLTAAPHRAASSSILALLQNCLETWQKQQPPTAAPALHLAAVLLQHHPGLAAELETSSLQAAVLAGVTQLADGAGPAEVREEGLAGSKPHLPNPL
jgi:hypothetical protein